MMIKALSQTIVNDTPTRPQINHMKERRDLRVIAGKNGTHRALQQRPVELCGKRRIVIAA